MNEKKAKRREWVKTAAIVFLSVMLVLTFFSNTIMNYSLPEVAAQYITSGTITAKIRGTGIVESGSLFNVKVTESRKVLSMEVRVGDTVEIGDIICYLDDSESDELRQAREQLELAISAYETALLTGNLSTSVLQNGGNALSAATYRKQIIAAQRAVETAQQEVDNAKKNVDDINNTIQAYDVQMTLTATTGDVAEENKAVKNAETELANARTEQLAAQKAMDALKNNSSVSEGDAAYSAAVQRLATANARLANAQTALANAQTALQNKIDNINANLQGQQNIYRANLVAAQRTLEEKQDQLTQKQQELQTLTTDIGATLQLSALNDAVIQAQERVNALEAKAIGATVTAEVAGTITSLSVVAGENTSPDVPVATIQPEGKGYTLSFSVTNEQAQRISVGDPAELVNSWWYSDITATVASIRPDPSSPNNQKLVTFNLTGSSVTAGQTLSLQVGQRSSNYDNIVPNSAIREDNNGKFILVVETRNSPLGNRYYATRYDVEVLASDDTQSAISGALYGYEYVITTATKPVEAGQMVRLPD